MDSYLAGLFEFKNSKKTHNPRFCITFYIKSEPLAKKLLDIIGSGFIRYKPNKNACVLVILPVIGKKKIVNLINGHLKTPKVYQLYNLISWLNKNHNTNIEKLRLKIVYKIIVDLVVLLMQMEVFFCRIYQKRRRS